MAIKNTLFISHVAPADNYFATWLSAKLKLLGYTVWVELDELKIGDAFWTQIEKSIKNDSIKFIPIVSKAYCEKLQDQTSGVFKELSCADRIRNIDNFLSPICIDETSTDDFPVQLMGIHSLNFFQNWQAGLDELLKSFKDQHIPFDDSAIDNPLPFWLDAFKINEVANDKTERIYTNWFPFELPNKIYIHQPLVARELDLLDIYYPFIVEANRHICFFPSLEYPAAIECISTYEYDIEDFLKDKILTVDGFYTLYDPKKKLIKLLNKMIQGFFAEKGLKKYDQANTEVYYFSNNEANKKRVSLKKFEKTNVAITGRHKDQFWCYGLSTYANLWPYPFFKINGHIIFENSNHSIPEAEIQHQLRQFYGSSWYNKDWLDTMLGCMLKLSDSDNDDLIKIPISKTTFLKINSCPINYDTDFGYNEPQKGDTENEQ